MADQDVATKAPENDAVSQSPFPNDSIAQEGASMGEHCVTDRPTPAGELPTGEMTRMADIDVYIAKPADYPHAPSKLLLLLTGGTGVKSTNNQLQADKFAAEGFLVIMPDQFGGDSAPQSTPEPTSPVQISFIERIKLGITDTARSFMIDMWLARQTPEKIMPRLFKVIESVKEEFADAVANGGGIYAVGYCVGAKFVLLLAGEHPGDVSWGQAGSEDSREAGMVNYDPVIKVGAIAHAAQVSPDDIAAVKTPLLLICVQNDPLFPDEVRQAGIEALEKNQVQHEVKVYPEVPHGFAVVGDYAQPTIKEAQQAAFSQILGWLKSH